MHAYAAQSTCIQFHFINYLSPFLYIEQHEAMMTELDNVHMRRKGRVGARLNNRGDY